MSGYPGGIRGLIQAAITKHKGGKTQSVAPGPTPRELANRVQSGSSGTAQARPPASEASTLGGRTLLGRGG